MVPKEIEELNDRLYAAIGKMADQVKAQPDSQRSLHCSQAALNLSHTIVNIREKAPVSRSKA